MGEIGLIQRDTDGKNTRVIRSPAGDRAMQVIVLLLKQYGYDDTTEKKVDVLNMI